MQNLDQTFENPWKIMLRLIIFGDMSYSRKNSVYRRWKHFLALLTRSIITDCFFFSNSHSDLCHETAMRFCLDSTTRLEFRMVHTILFYFLPRHIACNSLWNNAVLYSHSQSFLYTQKYMYTYGIYMYRLYVYVTAADVNVLYWRTIIREGERGTQGAFVPLTIIIEKKKKKK